MKRLFFAALLAAVSSTANAEQHTASNAEIEAIRAALETQLADAQSARFSNVRIDDKGNMCGLINAKNMMGAYVGYRPFTGMIFKAGEKTIAMPMGLDSPGPARQMCAEKGFSLPP